MEYQNTMKISFISKSQNEGFARVAVAAFISQLDPTLEEISDIKTAVSEAVTNAVIHGYENSEGMINVSCSFFNNTVEIVIEDKGKGIEDISKAREPLYTSKPELERSGMGFTVMETFMDEIEIESVREKGTAIRMRKKLKSLE
ncbi:MAG: anti-sigma F factor [Epulopiscium sp.]|nr:anti-sigma F factor [Candidatus Epulonipiscium sp.]